MSVVAHVKKSDGPMFYVASDGRVMGGKKLGAASFVGVRITRKPKHLYFVRGTEVHEQKAKGR